MKYDIPIRSVEHAEFCQREAERRYAGRMTIDEYGMRLVKDREGFTHTDDVLRAVSIWLREETWRMARQQPLHFPGQEKDDE